MATSNPMVEYSTKLKQAQKKMETEVNKAKLTLADVSQLKADLVLAEQAWDVSRAATVQAKGKVAAGTITAGRLLRSTPKSFLEGWLSCLKELGVLEDNMAWARAALAPDFPESPAPYSPLTLPGFDEEEFLNRLDEDEDTLEPVLDPTVTPGTEVSNPTKEIGRTVAKTFEERSVEETGIGGMEDADRIPPS
ncbi:hypothetical protein Acr_05g0010780 [Actinidia rufa]|uniref:Uncharacterized protein n=1 Tax=Actinidia rufa TaxID=165716 RepID=A0A7J0EN81_9ERIC|nr:hypothetical protein Acr_05g0010780 [Actinidia rufa]